MAPMSTFLSTFFSRPSVLVALTLTAVAACGGNGFSNVAGEVDATADVGPDGNDIIVGPEGGAPHDASVDVDADAAPERDGRADAADMDATVDSGPEMDSSPTHDAMPDVPVGCPTGFLECGGKCVPDDVNNCGTCGHDCANLPNVTGGATCGAGGVCGGTYVCATGYAHCTTNPDDGCETSITTSSNCGKCGNACTGTTPVCSNGACASGCSAPDNMFCPPQMACVDTTNDSQNCGSCNHLCTTGVANATADCDAGNCAYTCNLGYTGCPSAAPTTCKNLTTGDPSNCGTCGHSCPNPTSGTGSPTCSSAMCGLACSGTTPNACPATGEPTFCTNTTSGDPNNCGTCGHSCPNPTSGTGSPTCASGACGLSCTGATPNACPASGEPTFCTDLTAGDPNNCGTCGHACSTTGLPTNSHASCTASLCGWTCNTSYVSCDGSCLLNVPDQTVGVFVAQGGTGSNCTSAAPCGTLAAAEAAIQASIGTANVKTTIYVAESPTAYVGPINASNFPTLIVQGGWSYSGGTWSRSCPLDPTQTVITNGAQNYGFDASGSTFKAVTLDTLTLQVNSIGTAGESYFGIMLNGVATATLTNVDINVAGGGNGTPGFTGDAGAPAGPNGTCGSGDGGGGSAGPPGAGAPNWTYPSGGSGTSNATAGTAGTPGQPGTPSDADAGCVGGFPCAWFPGNGCKQSGTTEEWSCGTNGLSGCGSPGSNGGGAGTSGGSSIGIFVYGATVTTTNVKVVTGNGGTGGPGGGSDMPNAGTPGTTGSPASTGVPNACSSYTTQALCGDPIRFGTPGVGGPGGTGGTGGTGGGGAGGDSFCVLADTVTNVGAVSCTFGAAGTAGTGGVPAPAAGRSGATHTAP